MLWTIRTVRAIALGASPGSKRMAHKTAILLILLFLGALSAQVPTTPDPSKDFVFICPMDKDIRSHNPGNCSRCGMKLVTGVPEPVEYHLNLKVTPSAPKPKQKAHLQFEIHDPWKNNPVKKFTVIHEKLFHAFIVSQDPQFFLHDHPTWLNGAFHYDITFPKPGMYRILGDFYPEAATPQLIAKTVFVPGPAAPAASLTRDYSAKDGKNLHVELSTVPAAPVAGQNTQMHFELNTGEGLEKYLGAWGHML